MENVSFTWANLRSRLFYLLIGLVALAVLFAIAVPNLLRSRSGAPAQYSSLGVHREPTLAKRTVALLEQAPEPEAAADATSLDRRVVRKGSLEVIVDNPATALDQITGIARRHQGYVVSSELAGREQRQRGDITIRVPAAQFDEARAELKKLAKRVESEQTSADDVTMQYAENEATLRNYRAEEASYLQIMQRSGSIKDTLNVAQQLSDVRGRIERLQAQIRTLSLETEMTSISVNVSSEPVVSAPQRWRPLYELQLAWNDGVDALAGYATFMMALLLHLPAVLAWVATIVLSAKLCMVLFRLGSRFFRSSKPQVTAS